MLIQLCLEIINITFLFKYCLILLYIFSVQFKKKIFIVLLLTFTFTLILVYVVDKVTVRHKFCGGRRFKNKKNCRQIFLTIIKLHIIISHTNFITIIIKTLVYYKPLIKKDINFYYFCFLLSAKSSNGVQRLFYLQQSNE